MKKSNKEKIKKLLLYMTTAQVAEMLDMPLSRFSLGVANCDFTPEEEKLISKINPLKQIVLILSSQFMKSHPRAGEPTYFKEKIELGVSPGKMPHTMCDGTAIAPKLHTIRANYNEWVEKIAAVNRGEAFLRVVTWLGVPYNSPWEDVAILTAKDGIGVQELGFYWGGKDISCVIEKPFIIPNDATGIPPVIPVETIAKNDGLSLPDFKAWFTGYDLSKPLAIIHFTKFRY